MVSLVILKDLLLLFLALFILYFSFSTKKYPDFYYNIIENLFKNWQNKPYVDIIKSDSKYCPPEYEYLINDIWPGTIRGCACSPDILHKHICHETDTDDCINVDSVRKVHLHIWAGTNLCVKKSKKNYFDMFNEIKGKGMGIGDKCVTLDDIGNIYCSEDLDFITNTTSIINNSTVTLNTTNNINISDNQTKIIVELKISEDTPCIDPKEINTVTYPYRLLDIQDSSFYFTNKIKSEYNDFRYNLIDSELVRNYYEDNNMTSILSSLPLYSFPGHKINVGLYGRSYIGWNVSCSIDNLYNEFSNIYFVDSFEGLINIYAVIYILIVFSIFLLKRFYKKIGLKQEDSIQIPGLMDTMLIFFAVFGFIIVLMSIVYLGRLNIILKSTVDTGCSDNITKTIFKFIYQTLQWNELKNYYIMWIYIASILLFAIFYLINYFSERNQEVVKTRSMKKYSIIENEDY